MRGAGKNRDRGFLILNDHLVTNCNSTFIFGRSAVILIPPILGEGVSLECRKSCEINELKLDLLGGVALKRRGSNGSSQYRKNSGPLMNIMSSARIKE